MKHYSGYEYLLIDIANNFGLDKELFPVRIDWAVQHLHELEELANQAEEPMLYLSSVLALRQSQRGEPIGHLATLDATASGLQLMAVLSGCPTTAYNTGLVDPNQRSDIYTKCTETTNSLLSENSQVSVPRNDVKQALMTHFYGSQANPKAIFGEGSLALGAFYVAAEHVAPGACDLMNDMLSAWQPYALQHNWVLPDGFHVHVKVMQQKTVKFEVDELEHATFSHILYVNEGEKHGISLPANITHSVDGLVVREMNRRCHYNPIQVNRVKAVCAQALRQRGVPLGITEEVFFREFLATNVALQVTARTAHGYSDIALQRIHARCCELLRYPPFPLLCVHDAFKAHVNDLNWVRENYVAILAELADSYLMEDLYNQITGQQACLTKIDPHLSRLIRKSAYAIC